MDPDRYARAKAVFLAALELPPSAREGFIAGETAGDAALAAEVLTLLAAHGASGDALDRGALATLGAGPPAQLPASIAGYRILALLGRGGMGAVYRARRGEEPEVALKVLDTGLLSARLHSRLRREAEALRRLDHPAIARFLETGSYETPLGPQPYIVMRLVRGVPLAERARDTAWDDRARMRFVAEAAEALAFAHHRGVVHRDLKPDNLVVREDGGAAILDFGIAQVTQDAEPAGGTLTLTGDVLGTVRYMSPEQAQGLRDEIDGRSDLYSLAMVAYELLAGTIPYALETRSITRALVQVATAAPRPLGERRPELRGGLEAILERALEKRPVDRYPDAGAFADDLRRWLDGRPVAAAAGRRARRLRAFARTRAGLLTTVAAILAVAAGAALLTLPAVRHRIPPLAAADRRGILDRLDTADLQLHTVQPSRNELQSALGSYLDVRHALATFPDDSLTEDLLRYTWWRIGEVNYMIGAADHDPDRLQRAIEAFGAVGNYTRPRYYRPRFAGQDPVMGRIAAMTPEQFCSGQGMARIELARFREPAFHLRLALDARLGALQRFAATTGLADPALAPRGELAEQAARLLNEYGESLTRYGDVMDTLAFIDAGLASLRQARTVGDLRAIDRVAYASVLENLGEAHLARARRGHAAALDSARAELTEALAIRVDWKRRSQVDTRLALAELEMLAARPLPPMPAVRHLVAANRMMDLAQSALRADAAPAATWAPVWIERARLQLEFRARGADIGSVRVARAALDSAERVIDPGVETRPGAWIEYLRARSVRLAMPDPLDDRLGAREHLRLARERLPADQDRAFERRLTAETLALANAQRGRPVTEPPP